VSGNTFAACFSLVAGFAVALQAAMNSALGRRIGLAETVFVAGVMTTVLLASTLLVLRRGAGGLGELGGTPAWMWLGGLMGTIALAAISFAPGKIGVFPTLALFLSGQLAMGLAIDSFGLLETPRASMTATRVAGVVLVILGAALVLRR
jgi:transporter family-2 protein